MKRIWVLFAACSFLLSPTAQGQVGVYAEFSASQTNIADTGWIYGPTFGVYYTAIHLPAVNFGIDARGSVVGAGGSNGEPEIYSGMAGARAVVHVPLLPFKPYAEALIGASHVDAGQGFAYTSGTSFDYGFVAGADLTLLPRLDWRVVEYSYSRLPSIAGGSDQNTLSTGLVLRLPAL